MILIPERLLAVPAPDGTEDGSRGREDVTAAAEAFAERFHPRLAEIAGEYFARRGKDAVDALRPTLAAAEDARRSIRDGLANDRQRRLFDGTASRYLGIERDGMARHAAAQHRAWRDGASDAFVRAQIADCLRFCDDEGRYRLAVKSGLGEIEAIGAEAGRSKAEIARRKADFRSRAVLARVMGLANRDPAAAAAFYARARRFAAPAARAEIEPRLAHLVRIARAHGVAEAVLAGRPPAGIPGTPPTDPDPRAHLPAWLDQGERAAAAEAPGDAEFRELVRHRIAARVAAIHAGREDHARRVRNTLLAGALGTKEAKPAGLDALLATPETKLAWLDAPQEVRAGILRRLAVNAGGAEPPAGARALAVLDQAEGMRRTDPAAFRRLDLTHAAFDTLPADLRRRLVEAQERAAAAEPDSAEAIRARDLLAVRQSAVRPSDIDSTAKDWLR
ncbi:MAG: hypothetical protein M0006_03850 [Magnetospirillum sp.]|nr:hypothetical protein [Magnetospirillum sp.]